MPDTPEIWLDDFIANTTTTNSQYEPRITQLSNGNILIAWTTNDSSGVGSPAGTDIIGQLYDPLGNALGGEFRLNTFTIDNERDFDIAALNDGGFVVVYEDQNGSQAAQAIVASEWSTTSAGVATISASRTIATSPDAGDIVRTPTVTSAADGSYTVGYEDFDSSAGTNQLNFVNVTSAGVVGSEITAISGSGSATSTTSSARLTDGNVVFVYDWDTTDDAIAYSVRNPVTGASGTGGAFVANTNTNGDVDAGASVVALTGGGFVIAWTNTDSNDTDIEFQRYNNAGTVQGGVVTVAGPGSTDNNNEINLVALSDGGFLVLWDDDEGGQNAGRGQRYTAAGSTVGSVFSFDSSNANHTDAVLLGDGRVALTWQDGEIHAAIIDTRDAPNGTAAYAPDQYVVGTVGDDDFTADSAAEFVFAYDGNDIIHESGPTRAYYGGRGDDLIHVNSQINADEHYGGGGNDTIDWTGNVFELAGSTLVFDLLAGTAVNGGSTEVMQGFENLRGTGLVDEIYGTNAANMLFGAAGADIIMGRRGADVLKGQAGSDMLNGGKGNDLLVGGGAADTFVFAGKFGDDRIRHFAENKNAEDIDLSGVKWITGFNDLRNNHMTQVGADVVIDDQHGNTITVLDVALGDMNRGDFLF